MSNQPTDHRLNRTLGVIAFAVLMSLLWLAQTDPDISMLSMGVMSALIVLILVLLGLTDHLTRVIKVWRGGGN